MIKAACHFFIRKVFTLYMKTKLADLIANAVDGLHAKRPAAGCETVAH